MIETVQVLNIHICNMKAARAMKVIQPFFKTDSLNIIEAVSMDTLLQAEEEPELQSLINTFDLVFPGNVEILKAAGTTNETLLKEVEEGLVWKNIAKQVDRRRMKTFLLADSEEKIQDATAFLKKHYHGIQVKGSAVISEASAGESIVNSINAAGVDCVGGILPSPIRERFIADNRALINAKLWIGMDINMVRQESNAGSVLRSILMKLLFRRKVVKEKKEME